MALPWSVKYSQIFLTSHVAGRPVMKAYLTCGRRLIYSNSELANEIKGPQSL